MNRFVYFAATLTVITACTTSPGSESPIMGTLGGANPGLFDVIAFNDGQFLKFQFSDYADSCMVRVADQYKQDSSYLDLVIFSPFPGTLGTVTIGTPTGGDAYFKRRDATCMSTKDTGIGSFTETQITASTIKGTFDLTFPDGHLTADFTAQICGAGAPIVGSGSAACVP